MGPNTDVYHSCSATLDGEMFLFGGYDRYTKQVLNKIQDPSQFMINYLRLVRSMDVLWS